MPQNLSDDMNSLKNRHNSKIASGYMWSILHQKTSAYIRTIVAQFQEVKRSTGRRLVFASVLTLLSQWDQGLERL